MSWRFRMKWFFIVVAAGAAAGMGPAVSAPAARSSATTHTVVIEAMRFDPQELTVEVGERIVWVNRDPFPHTVTAVNRQFDSHEIAAGGSWTYIPKTSGVSAYACSLHPAMTGTLHVE